MSNGKEKAPNMREVGGNFIGAGHGYYLSTDKPSLDLDTAQAFLERRFGDREGYVAIGVSYQDSWFKEYFFKWPSSNKRLLNIVKAVTSNGRANIFVCPVLRASGDLDKFNGLMTDTAFADLDGTFDIPEALVPYLEIVKSGSSGNRHVYLKFEGEMTPEDLETTNYGLMQMLNADSKWSNASYLRLPGTFNHKTVPPASVEVVQLGKQIQYHDFAEIVGASFPSRSQVPQHPRDEEINSIGLVSLETELPDFLLRWFYEPSNHDRSGQSFRFIMALFEHGCSINEVYTLASEHVPTLTKYGNRPNGIKAQVKYLHNKYIARIMEVGYR